MALEQQALEAAREFALTAASQAFHNRGIEIACPWEGDLDDLERERFDAMVAAIDAYVSQMQIDGYLAALGDGWQPIETAPKDKTPVIIAVPNKEQTSHIVGEAYFDPENSEGGDWWWAGTGWGDYHGGPIREINYHPPTHWYPLPTPPGEKK